MALRTKANFVLVVCAYPLVVVFMELKSVVSNVILMVLRTRVCRLRLWVEDLPMSHNYYLKNANSLPVTNQVCLI